MEALLGIQERDVVQTKISDSSLRTGVDEGVIGENDLNGMAKSENQILFISNVDKA
jgi:hypothetical protein